MRAKLSLWMRSWEVWAIVVCLAIGVLRWWGPANAAMGPPGVWITQRLWVVAFLVLTWFVLKYVAFRSFMYFYGEGEKKGGRTDKAKEKLADSFMSFSTAVGSALLISVLVIPFTAFIQGIARDIDPVETVVSRWPPAWWSGRHTVVFLLLFFMPIFMSLLARRQALDLYDELTPAAPGGGPDRAGDHQAVHHPGLWASSICQGERGLAAPATPSWDVASMAPERLPRRRHRCRFCGYTQPAWLEYPRTFHCGFFGENAEFWAVALSCSHQGYRQLSCTSASNPLMKHCLLRWQDERLFSTCRPRSRYLLGFPFNLRFPRVPTSVCVVMDKFPSAQNFSVSPKKP